jgi:hypothetical protein
MVLSTFGSDRQVYWSIGGILAGQLKSHSADESRTRESIATGGLAAGGDQFLMGVAAGATGPIS